VSTLQLQPQAARGGSPAGGWPLLQWAAVFAGVAIAVVGLSVGSRLLAVGGIVGAALPLALAMPELMLGLFLVSGGIKAAPWLQGLPFDLTLAAAAGVLAAMAASVKRNSIGLAALAPPTALAGGIAALVLLTTLWSPDPTAGLDKALRFQFLTMLAFAAPLVLIRSRQSLVRVTVAIVAFALLIALTSVSTGDLAAPLQSAGGNEIQLGIYAAFGLIAVVAYLGRIGPPRRRAMWLAPAVLLAATVLEAGSRGALVSGTLALLFVWSQIARTRQSRVIGLGLAAAVIIALATGAGGLAGSAAVRYRQSLLTTSPSAILRDRGQRFDEGWRLAVAHPLGVGTAGYNALTGGLQYPHNIILELASEQGLIGVALFVALVIAAWRARRLTTLGPRSPEAVLTGALIVLFFAESLFSDDINGNRLLWFALGLALAVRRLAADPVGQPVLESSWVPSILPSGVLRRPLTGSG
jgi:O-antigen ligase